MNPLRHLLAPRSFLALSFALTLAVAQQSPGDRTLAPDTDLASASAPDLAQRAFTVTVRLVRPGTEGVLVAHGGQAHGWALFFQAGRLHFALNRASERHEALADDPALKTARELSARLAADGTVELSADGRNLAQKKFPGVLLSAPIDGLQVGRDLAAPVGGYTAPFAFNGAIRDVTVRIGGTVPPAPEPAVVKLPPAQPTATTDRFGGDLRVQREATGYFRVEQINGRWFFITPEGHPFIALGVNHMGPFLKNQARETGLLARHGNDPARMTAEFLPVIRRMGFTAGDVYQPEESYKQQLPWITFFWYGAQNQTDVDVFDAAQLAEVARRATAHARSVADNPWVLGLGGPDLQIWDNKLVKRYRQAPPESAGRRRYAAFLRERHGGDIAKVNTIYGTAFASFDDLAAQPKIIFPTDLTEAKMDPWIHRWALPVLPEKSPNPPAQADNDAFCALIAETLFPVVRAACKAGAPHHLFLGEHLAVRMIPDAVIKVMAKHVDAYLAQAVEVSPQRPPEWQIFQTARWDHEYALLQKPIIVVDWGAVFSYGDPFEYRGATIKSEKEASDDAAQFVTDAFDRPYIIGLFLCKLLGDHRNDANFFQDRATRTYLRSDGTKYAYRSDRLSQANHAVIKKTYAHAAAPP